MEHFATMSILQRPLRKTADDMISLYSHGESCISFYSSFTAKPLYESNYKDLQQELMQSRVSLMDQTAASSDCMSFRNSFYSQEDVLDEEIKRLIPLMQIVERFSQKLFEDPPPTERTCQKVMQILWTLLKALEKSSKCQIKHENKEKMTNPSVASLAVNYGAIPVLTSIMKTFKGSLKAQIRGILLLGALGENSAENQDVIAECHGVSYILAALVHPQHSKSSRLCLEACDALVKVTSHSTRCVFQLVHGDGVRTIHATMRLFTKKHEIQEYALRLLNHLAKHAHQTTERGTVRKSSRNGSQKSFQLLEFLEDPELIELVVYVVSRHRKVKPILKHGGSLLNRLAIYGTSRTKSSLVWSKAVPVVVKISKEYISNASTQLECIDTLVALCIERPEARDMVVEDGCAFLFESMATHRTHVYLQQKACRMLHMLCDHRQTIVPISKCFRKNSKYRKILQTIEFEHRAICGILVAQIIHGLSA